MTEADPRQFEELAAEVDRLLLSISARIGHADPMRTALLACLQLAEQLRRSQQEPAPRSPEQERRLALLMEQLRNAVAEPSASTPAE